MAPLALQHCNRSHHFQEVTIQPEWSRVPEFVDGEQFIETNTDFGLPFVEGMLERFGIDPLTIKCFSNTWRKSTKKTYKSHLLRWGLWAKQNDVSILNPKIQEVLIFFTCLF